MRNLLARREAARTSTSEPVPEPPPPASADFETAIAACGFGCFNVLILFIAWPVLLAVLFSVMSMSFILPIAGRDLDIVLSMKGVLYALPFAGMILSAVPWAFISDTLGRRVVLISGGWLWLICVLCLALSQNSTQLMVFKFIDGLIICGPLASIYSYLSEFHAKQHRSMVILYVSICGSMAALILPIMAIFFLPLSIDFHIGSLSFKTWNVFLAISAVPSLIYGLMLIFLPETPKFLMSQGNYSAALKSLQFAYALNNRKSRKPFPITKLMDDSPESFQLEHSTLRQRFHLNMLKFVEGWRQLKPLCSRLYLPTAMKAFLINFLASVCISTMRAYLPSICHVMKILRNSDQADCSMCNVFEYITRINATTEDDPAQCQGSYEEYLLVPVIGLVCSIIFLPIIRNNKIAIHLLKFCLGLCTLLMIGLYFSSSLWLTLSIVSIYCGIMTVCSAALMAISVAVFPTLMRTMMLMLIMTCGRAGSFVGTFVFHIFMHLGCLASFLWLTIMMAIAFIISLFLTIDVHQPLK